MAVFFPVHLADTASWVVEDFNDSTLNDDVTHSTVDGGDSIFANWDSTVENKYWARPPFTGDTIWTFTPGIKGFGGIWNLIINNAGICLDIYAVWPDSEQLVGTIPNNYFDQFWGFVSDECFWKIRITGGPCPGNAEEFTLDNMTYTHGGEAGNCWDECCKCCLCPEFSPSFTTLAGQNAIQQMQQKPLINKINKSRLTLNKEEVLRRLFNVKKSELTAKYQEYLKKWEVIKKSLNQEKINELLISDNPMLKYFNEIGNLKYQEFEKEYKKILIEMNKVQQLMHKRNFITNYKTKKMTRGGCGCNRKTDEKK